MSEFKGGWRLRRDGGRWRFEFDLPLGMVATGTGDTKPDAMRSAAALAKQAIQNPAMQALLPPQARVAIKAASVLARSPEARKAWSVTKKAGSSLGKLARSLF